MSRCSLTLMSVLVLGVESVAFAQTAPTPPPAPAAPAAPAATPPPSPVAPAPSVPAAPIAENPKPAEAAAAPAPKWYDAVALDAFVDAYGSINYNFPKPQTLTGGFGGNQYRAFDTTNGFALNWVGVNASYAPDPVGGTISLRVGPAARIYAGTDNQYGLEIVKQAFASWKPGGKDSPVQIDFGKYDQPYGSEVAETQFNMNYSRSALFNYAQPLFFTGFRVDYQATPQLDLKLILANGWNNSVSPNYGKTGGIQVNFKPSDTLFFSAGYAVGPQQVDGTAGGATVTAPVAGPGDVGNLRHLVDGIADLTFGKLRFLLNGDFVTEQVSGATVKWYGVNLGIHYAVSDPVGIALRGEYFADPEGFATGTGKSGTNLVDGTLTLEGKVTPNLILKLEQRLDVLSDDAGDALFQKKLTDTSKTQTTTMLGVVVKTN